MSIQKKLFGIVLLTVALAMSTLLGMLCLFVSASDTQLFPNGDCELPVADSGLTGQQFIGVSDQAHGGTQAYLFNGGSASFESTEIAPALQSGLSEGVFYEYSFYAKYVYSPASTSTAISYLTVFDYQTGSNDINLGLDAAKTYFYVDDTGEYIQRKHVICFYQPQEGGVQFYVDDREMQQTGLVRIAAVRFSFGTIETDQVLFDDFSFAPVSLEREVKVTLRAGDDSPLTGQTLIVKDSQGTAVEGLTVTESEGVYTIQGLTFSSVTEKYQLQVEGVSDFTGEISYQNLNPEYSVQSYNATITVKDNQGNSVTDAKVTFGNVAAANNGDGTYSFSSLNASGEVKVEKTGYLPVYLTIGSQSANPTVQLQAVVSENHLDHNIFPNGNFEADSIGWEAPAVKTDRYQKDGVYSMLLDLKNGQKTLIRAEGMDKSAWNTGASYVLKMYALKVSDSAAFSIEPVITGQNADGGWVYAMDGISKSVELIGAGWQEVTLTFEIKFDPSSQTIQYRFDGGEPVTVENFASVAAFDLRLAVSSDCCFAVDNVALMQCYEVAITFTGCTAQMSDISFAAEDLFGSSVSVLPVDDGDGKVTVSGLYGNFDLFLSKGGEPLASFTASPTNTVFSKNFPHALSAVEEKAPTAEESGNIAYWTCTECGTYFSDAEGTTEIADKKTVNTYLITYETDGGTNAAENPATYTYGTAVTLADATKEGYTFEGWYTDAEFTTKVTEISAAQEGNVTLYAKFTKISVSYTVTIQHSEDKMSATVIVVTGGTAVDVSALSAEGYKLVGVYTDAEYTQAYTTEMKITADTTLYAKWESLSTEDTDDETEPEKEGGCGASVAGASAAIGMLAMGAAAVALGKKKRV